MSRSVGDRILTPMLYIFSWCLSEPLLWGYSLGCVLSLCVLSGAWALGPDTSSSSVSVLVSDLDAHSPCLCTTHLLNSLAMCSCQVGVFLFYFFEHVLWWFICHMLLYVMFGISTWLLLCCFYMLCALQSNVLTHHPLVTLLLVHLPHLLS